MRESGSNSTKPVRRMRRTALPPLGAKFSLMRSQARLRPSRTDQRLEPNLVDARFAHVEHREFHRQVAR